MRQLSTAADVYGLGAVLYEVVTGVTPFQGDTAYEVLQQVIGQEARRPSALNPAVDRDLETIVLKCLEKDPGRRYGTAAELADDLERWSLHAPIHARPSGLLEGMSKWTRRHPWKAAFVATLVAAVASVGLVSALLGLRVAAEAERNRDQVVRLNVAAGVHLAEDGDPSLALGHFLAALDSEASSPGRARVERRRIAAALRQSPELAWVGGAQRGGGVRLVQPGWEDGCLSRGGWDRPALGSRHRPRVAAGAAAPGGGHDRVFQSGWKSSGDHLCRRNRPSLGGGVASAEGGTVP
ncbi:MAG TPA: hypothetical protein DCM86_16580 [Verrucomicrobiales bacterium]|nr:hypothetical protein [Verrucomicrobiales bacterium]